MATMRAAERGPHCTKIQADDEEDQPNTARRVGDKDHKDKAHDRDGGWLATQSMAVDYTCGSRLPLGFCDLPHRHTLTGD